MSPPAATKVPPFAFGNQALSTPVSTPIPLLRSQDRKRRQCPVIELQRVLAERFAGLRDTRHGAVFFVEHGLDVNEYEELRGAVRRSLRLHALDSGGWDNHGLPVLVVATEVGYRYRGSGTDFWPLMESEIEAELSAADRQRIRDFFVDASNRFRGVRPATTAWAEAFHFIAWPIAHALLPLEFHRPFAMTLANIRRSASESNDAMLYRAVRGATSYPSARFATLLEDDGLVVSLTRSLLGHESSEISSEIIRRVSSDLSADHVARRNMVVARSNQRAVQANKSALQIPDATPTRGTLRLRRAAGTLLLEASFPQLDPEVGERLRRTLRRRRFTPQLWGVTARVSSDQLLSGLPFHLKFAVLPESDAQLFPDLDPAEFDAPDLAILHAFQLQLAPPYLFAVTADAEIARSVHGSTISGHRTYWALLRPGEEVPQGVRTVGAVGPLRCVELDPVSTDGARALAQLGYDIRFGVSVRFAGSPSVNRDDDVPTFIAGDRRVIVPERLVGEAALVIDFDGISAEARASEAVRVIVETGPHRVKVSSDTDAREYSFRGIEAPLPRNAPVYLSLLSRERTIQALLGGRLTFMVDGAAPIDGLELTVDLDLGGGRVFSVTGPLGPIPQRITPEHAVMTALLSEDVQDYVSGSVLATLRVQIGHLARAAWELERIVRPCWWELRGGPRLLSESGPIKFGVVSAGDPVRAPTEGATGGGTYLLAPLGLDPLEFGEGAAFATLCLAPSRVHLGTLSIAKPRLERRRRGSRSGVGLEDLAEAYLRWSLAETSNGIGELHRRYVATSLEEWMTEICCGQAWALAEAALPGRDAWRTLEQVCHELGVGRDDYLGLASDVDAQVRKLAIEEIRRSIPALWARVHPPSDLDERDYETLDRAFATAYGQVATQYRKRGRQILADELQEADPGESPDEWDEALSCVCNRVEMHELASMLIPSDSAARLMNLNVTEMTLDDIADELLAWCVSARKAFAGTAPSRDVLKTSYSLWTDPALALTGDWRVALDTLLAERGVARATRYLAVKARAAQWGDA